MRFYAALGLVVACGALPAHAEIHLYDSVEWLCQRSEIVARGTLTAVSDEAPSRGEGKSRDLVSLTLQPVQILRGEMSAGKAPAPIHFSMRLPDTVRLRQWMKERKELVVFLRRTIQSYRRDGITYDLWPVRETGTNEQVLVDRAHPHVHLLSAGAMDHAHTPAQLEAACRRTSPDPKPAPNAEPAAELLEVPEDSPVYRTLYSGSSCYLYVPVGVFKGAKRSL